MSIDRLINQIDQADRDYETIHSLCVEGLHDFKGILQAYSKLFDAFIDEPDRVAILGQILHEVVESIQTFNQMILILGNENPNPQEGELEQMAGKLLHGEQIIGHLIEEFENLEDLSGEAH